MSQGDSQSKRPGISDYAAIFSLFVAIVSLLVAIWGVTWQIDSSRSGKVAIESQLNNQATQIALNAQEAMFADEQVRKQGTQIALSAEQSRLFSDAATVDAKQLNVVISQATFMSEQLDSQAQSLPTPLPGVGSLNPTETFLADEAIRLEATRQAIENRNLEIQATQTAVAGQGILPELPQPTPTFNPRQGIAGFPGYYSSESNIPLGTSMEITVNEGEDSVTFFL